MHEFDFGDALARHLQNTYGDWDRNNLSQLKEKNLSIGPELIGCLLDPDGQPLERRQAARESLCSIPNRTIPMALRVPSPLARRAVDKIFCTGIRALDAFTTVGRGQRLAIFAQPGVGKSRLIASIAKNSAAQLNVIGLIGERGREVQEFVDSTLPKTSWPNTIVVASTSDQNPAMRLQAAHTATQIANYFRDHGCHVLLQIDSLTRVARAYRDIGFAAGEPPVRRGYPASVFERLPTLLECPGAWSHGSITAFYSLLLSDDIDEDPIVEETKSLVDGHIFLDRQIAETGRYPAINIRSSLSRLQDQLIPMQAQEVLRYLRRLSLRFEMDRDLLALGAEADQELRCAVQLEDGLERFLAQETDTSSSLQDTFWELEKLYQKVKPQPDRNLNAPLTRALDESSSDTS